MTAYSKEHSALAIHIPKAAGKSLKAYLADHLPDLRGRLPADVGDDSEPENFPRGHLNLRQACTVLGREPSDFDLILAVRRNPYEQQFSQWVYWRNMRIWDDNHGQNLLTQHEIAVMHPTFENWLQDPRSQFHVYYDHLQRDEDTNLAPKTGLGYSDFGGFYPFFLGDESGEIPENVAVIDINNLSERLPEIVGGLIDEEPSGEVPRRNEGPKVEDDVYDHLTPEAAKVIEERFRYAFDNWYERRSRQMLEEEEGLIV